MTHALINTFTQMASGGNEGVSFVCRGMIILISLLICYKENGKHEN